MPSEKTIAQIACNDEEIIFRFTCFESEMKTALAPIPKDPHHQYYLDVLAARTHIYHTNSINLFIDPSNIHAGKPVFGFTPCYNCPILMNWGVASLYDKNYSQETRKGVLK